eukprot:TCONS_00003520-protein
MENITMCHQIIRISEDLSQSTKDKLALIYITFGVFGILVNLLLAALIKVTKRFRKNQSMRLIMFLSIIDFQCCLFLNACYILYIWYIKYLHCSCIIVLYGISRFAMYSASYIALLMGLDRFLHIKYLNEYSSVYTKFRFRLSLLLYFILVLILTLVTAILNTKNGLGYAGRYTAPINVCLIVFIVALYVISIFIMRRHKKANIKYSKRTRRVIRVASAYLILFIALQGFLGCYQVMSIIQRKRKQKSESVLWFIVYLLPSLSGILNAVFFAVINKVFVKKTSNKVRDRVVLGGKKIECIKLKDINKINN